MDLKHFLLKTPFIGQITVFLFRTKIVFGFLFKQLIIVLKWLFSSKETTNLTYDLTPLNEQHLRAFVANVTGEDYQSVCRYMDEIENDQALLAHIETQVANSKWSIMADKQARFGRRKGWYALIRILKPKVVIETGVDKGLGACVIASALMRNKAEGYEGYYYGTDINPKAGYLLSGAYKEFGEILYGDSIESLTKFDKPIDMFINDSDHSVDYEADEYRVIKDKLADNGIILGDNSHCSDKLLQFSIQNQRNFMFFHEQPADHWYPGGGIGVSLRGRSG